MYKKGLFRYGGAAVVDPQDTGFTFTVTTTGAQTLTLAGMTVAAGKSVVVDWGDTNTNTYTAGAGARTHAYAGAGTYTVKITKRRDVTLLNLGDAKITSLVINSTNPLPTGLTSLTLSALAGFTYNANTNPLPTGLTSLYLYSIAGLTYNANTNPLPTGLTSLTLSALAGLTWDINNSQKWPVGATTVTVLACNNVTCSAWTNNAVHSIQWESSCNAAKVDSILLAIWTNKANFTFATPTLDLLGGSNAAPNGTYQAASPPTTGKEYAYDLVNGSYTPAGPEWIVQTA
jgi:hypothetical protein